MTSSTKLYSNYIPIDRRQFSKDNTTIPEQQQGAALFADISGFTPLTAVLAQELGRQRGAEELSAQLNRVYTALIVAVHNYRGSVISFSGDAITCWFDEDLDGARATTCALQMQSIMQTFKSVRTPGGSPLSLAIKVAITIGSARRFLVGDPQIQLIDVLAGNTLDRMALAESMAESGDIVIEKNIATNLGTTVQISQWRQSEDGQEFGLVSDLQTSLPITPWPDLPDNVFTEEQTRPWLHNPIYERLRTGQTQFLAELRTVVALFLNFGGLDYDYDEQVGQKLNSYIQWVQNSIAHYDGTLLQLSTGDKGSYLYASFGAPITYEDNVDRALAAALELRTPPSQMDFIHNTKIGISQGQMWVGAYGSPERSTYGVLGDETNIAARLMSKAKGGQILVTPAIITTADSSYQFDEIGLTQLKGKQKPILLSALIGRREPSSAPTLADTYMIGRDSERKALYQQLEKLQAGQRSNIIIEGEAGIGKSLLAMSFLQQAADVNIQTYLGTANAIESATAYYAWWPIFRQIFDLSEQIEPAAGRQKVEAWLNQLDSDLSQRAPLLNSVLPLDFSENELTQPMEGQVRAENTNNLLVRILDAAMDNKPLALVLEDAHWLDSASWALVQQVQQRIASLTLVLVTRPLGSSQSGMAVIPNEYKLLRADPHTHHVELLTLAPQEILQLVCHRLSIEKLPQAVETLIREKAEGHPFFSEELAYALRDANLIKIENGICTIPTEAGDLNAIDFPDTIQGVIISRIDRLPVQQQLLLKVASVIGRIFAFSMLDEVHPIAEDKRHLSNYLENLEKLDITPLESPLPNLAYIFKHVITQEVAYNLMTFAQRRNLHQSVALWYEENHQDLSQFLPLLAYHWSKAENRVKAINFLERAGEQALQRYANQEAIDFLNQATVLADKEEADTESQTGFQTTPLQRAQWAHQLGEAYFRLGRMTDGDQYFRQALHLLGRPVPELTPALIDELMGGIEHSNRPHLQQTAFTSSDSNLNDEQTNMSIAYKIYVRFAETAFLNNDIGLTLYCTIHSLAIAERMGPSAELGHAYSQMVLSFGAVGVHPLAQLYQQLALSIMEQIDAPLALGDVLWSISIYTAGIGDWDTTEDNLAQSLALFERYGNWSRWGICLEVISRVAYNRGQFYRLGDISDRLAPVATRRNDYLHRTWIHLNRLEYILFTQSDYSEVLDLAGKAMALVRKSQEVGSEMMTHALTAVSHARFNNWEQVEEAADKAFAIISAAPTASFGMYVAHSNTTAIYLDLWHREENPDRLSTRRERAKAACDAFSQFAAVFPFAEPRALLYQGVHQYRSGKSTEAQELWRQSLVRGRDLNMPYEVAMTNYEMGRLLPKQDAQKLVHLQQAARAFEQMGALHDLNNANALIQTMNEKQPPGGSV